LGTKNLKAVIIIGDGSFPLREGKDYPKLFEAVYQKLTATDMMQKYHNLGTPVNVAVLNELKAMPWRNLQATSDPDVHGISGERFAETALLRNAACAGCPVGCIHIGFSREKFQADYRYFYRQVSYDHEPIFATGSMLGVTDCFKVLDIIDAVEQMGLDVMSAGVALAWATEALEKGIVTEKETLLPLQFGRHDLYEEAVRHLAFGVNDFYRLLGQGALKAGAHYGGADFACVLGQEMAGYATGEVFFVSQALGLRHSHLDAGGYAYDQKHEDKDVGKAVDFLLADEAGRAFLTSMAACLFARGVYDEELLAACLQAVGYGALAAKIDEVSRNIQKLRWQTRLATGFDFGGVSIPKRFTEVTTWKGRVDGEFLSALKDAYSRRLLEMAGSEDHS
jgi:aldehyde:ferredoxin oxidoreductase